MANSGVPVYEATAAKRRPKSFDELVGQEFVVSTLKNSLEKKQIAHAYLFSGPRGCGKTSAARILARSLNCEKGPAAVPCGVCANCRAISQGANMDVIEIDGASNTSVNDVRQIKDEVLFPPQSGPYKVYIIDEVHMLSNSAFNALLKTIEEPPPYIIFIFATTELHKVPATIKSRCQQFSFRLIPIETIQGILKKICAETGIQAEDEALFWIARESTGSLRDAFTLFDQVASFSGGRIREELIREKLGLAGLEELNALAEACAANDTPGAFARIDKILDSGVSVEQCVIDLAAYYRSLLLLKNGITRESLLGYSPKLFSEKVLRVLDSIRLEQALDTLLACYRDIRYSVSPRFELETAVSKLSWLGRWVSPPELKAALDGARQALRSGEALRGEEVPRGGDALPARSGGEASRPLAEGTPEAEKALADPETQNGVQAPGGRGVADYRTPFGGGSLSEDFRRMLLAKASGTDLDEFSGAIDVSGDMDEDENKDVPFWSSLNQDTEENGKTPAAESADSAENPGYAAEESTAPEVKRVLRIIPGALIKGLYSKNPAGV
ncbi:MAG: DNA polymerase III subunit gamma/tau [Treponema sp.]|jgi:DNA polymerase-3 subunit gamma/tau|nr:DNA polymerase III subunit gamma/tau [Treponema sp.]